MHCDAQLRGHDPSRLTRRCAFPTYALFKFRDQMAHGKTIAEDIAFELDTADKKLPNLKRDNYLQAFAKIERATDAIQDVEQLVKGLHVALGYVGNPFRRLGGGKYAVTKTSA